ncbi:histidine phosphatase family protein [Aquabacterium sp. A7-Y]|uniref:histidine phosphatase family protein n=1 Tax=Aquabacterium sp. A7-Y TaxID=1349605 RepID=UPI00223E38AE|nr:histidine phosphatase family protein [Aquabacterium sp. A7-Y]MCW7537556.1 histidine phosphatase family protein [Aquabacterium sp. A7-Y]
MECVIWRHPAPRGAAGRCIGVTDLQVDARKAKRLAHRVRAEARRQRWPREVWTSPLERGVAVGRWLRRWGWRHRRDARLAELDFGAWEGRAWADVAAAEVQAWCEDFARFAPGGGEPLEALFERCRCFLDEVLRECGDQEVVLIVGHGGWINTVAGVAAGSGVPQRAADWPPAPRYGALRRFTLAAASSA